MSIVVQAEHYFYTTTTTSSSQASWRPGGHHTYSKGMQVIPLQAPPQCQQLVLPVACARGAGSGWQCVACNSLTSARAALTTIIVCSTICVPHVCPSAMFFIWHFYAYSFTWVLYACLYTWYVLLSDMHFTHVFTRVHLLRHMCTIEYYHVLQ